MTDKMTRERVAEIVYEVIHERADQMIRERMAEIVAEVTHEQVAEIVAAARAKTLADMTDEERAACQWMQADVAGHSTRYVIANPDDGEGDAGLVSAYGGIEWMSPERVTPRPDLPRMEWPGTGQGAEDATPAKAGTLIESADDPRLDALPDGSVLLDRDGDAVTKQGEAWTGDGYIPNAEEGDEFGPWTVLHVG